MHAQQAEDVDRLVVVHHEDGRELSIGIHGTNGNAILAFVMRGHADLEHIRELIGVRILVLLVRRFCSQRRGWLCRRLLRLNDRCGTTRGGAKLPVDPPFRRGSLRKLSGGSGLELDAGSAAHHQIGFCDDTLRLPANLCFRRRSITMGNGTDRERGRDIIRQGVAGVGRFIVLVGGDVEHREPPIRSFGVSAVQECRLTGLRIGVFRRLKRHLDPLRDQAAVVPFRLIDSPLGS